MAFQWKNLSKRLSKELARQVGLRITLAAEDLSAKYGELPTEAFIDDMWRTLRDRWLATRPVYRDRVVTELRKAGLGDASIRISSKTGQMDYLGSCRQSNRLKAIVLAAFLDEGSQPVIDASAMSNSDESAPIEINIETARFFDDSSISADGKPHLVIVMGGVAAGKTTLRKTLFSTGFVVLDAAEIFLNLCRGKTLDFPDGLEEVMEIVGALVASRAVVERRNIVIELLGADVELMEAMIELVQSIGYTIGANLVKLDVEEAQRRNLNRGKDCISAYYAEPFHIRWLTVAAQSASHADSPDRQGNWKLAHAYEYWDSKTDAIIRFSESLRGIKETKKKKQILKVISKTIETQVEALPDDLLLGMAVSVVDDLYKCGDTAEMLDEAMSEYIAASCGTFLRLLSKRGFQIHYVVDLAYGITDEGTIRPVDFFPHWFPSAGIIYICPQHLALTLMEKDGHDRARYLESMPRYIAEACHLASKLVEKCHKDKRHFVYLDTDSGEERFDRARSLEGMAGVLAVFRDTPTTIASKVAVRLPGRQ